MNGSFRKETGRCSEKQKQISRSILAASQKSGQDVQAALGGTILTEVPAIRPDLSSSLTKNIFFPKKVALTVGFVENRFGFKTWFQNLVSKFVTQICFQNS
jgi:hypothetical protein